jgi:phage terminase small subunit
MFQKDNPEKDPNEPVEVDEDVVKNARAYQIWSYSETGHELTVEEQLFVRSYIIDRNPVASLRRIGYVEESSATLKRRAERMLANTEVQDAIAVQAKRIMEALEITAERVNEQVAGIAFFDPGEVMEFDHNGVKMISSRYWSPKQRANVVSIKQGKDGVEVKLADRQKALDFLGKQLNLVDDDKEMARAAAEAAAEAATGKLLEVVTRMKEGVPKKLPKGPEDAPTVQ